MIHEGEVLGGTYQVIRQIGRGGTGQVFKAYHLNLRKYVVIKRVWRGTGNLEALRAETDVLKNLRHSNIPQVYDFLVREGEVFTVMDYIEGNDLDQLPAGTGRMSENYLVQLLLQLASVLSYLHRNKPPVIHSDIKPDNLILAKDGKLCLIDFNALCFSGTVQAHYGYPRQSGKNHAAGSPFGYLQRGGGFLLSDYRLLYGYPQAPEPEKGSGFFGQGEGVRRIPASPNTLFRYAQARLF